jgi:low affinity Fe/Cu permease
MHHHSGFGKFAKWASHATGHPAAFLLAMAIVVVWGAAGPFFGFSEPWQMVINTSTTIVTFLMIFLIQSTQNRDTTALQIKLDELIRVTRGAHTALLDLEELEEHELEQVRANYRKLAAQARDNLQDGADDTDTPAVELPGSGAAR